MSLLQISEKNMININQFFLRFEKEHIYSWKAKHFNECKNKNLQTCNSKSNSNLSVFYLALS